MTFRAALITLGAAWAFAVQAQSVSIVATVNDEAISAIDVEARTTLLAQSGELPAGTATQRERARAVALDELIDDALRRQEAERLSIALPTTEVDEAVAALARQNGLSVDAMTRQLGPMMRSLRQRLQADIAWRQAINRQFAADVDVTEAEVDQAEAQADQSFIAIERDTVIGLKQIFAPVSPSAGAQELADARRLVEEGRVLATGCEGLSAVHQRLGLEDLSELGALAMSELPNDIRLVVERLPIGRPSRAIRLRTGFAVLFVCDRDFVADTAVDREALEGRLRAQKLETFSERRLRDLRRSAIIERR